MNPFEQGLLRYLDAGFLDYLRTVRVGVIGAGGLGSNCAMHLVRSGFSDLVLADPDSVEPSNLNRQNYSLAQVGTPKVEALKANLQAVNPDARVETHRTAMDADNMAGIFGSCRAVVEAVDDARTKKLVVETLAAPERLVVGASGIGGTGCAGRMRVVRLMPGLVLVGDMTTPCDADNPPLSPGVGMAAAMQADVVLDHFLAIYKESIP
jgi:sulfur carrier protein ThiS adenylyltransferase